MIYLERLIEFDEASSSRMVVEPRNVVGRGDESWAYDLGDTESRLERLYHLLTKEELSQLIERDEFEGLVAHAAEVAGVPVFPYEEAVVSGEVGSLVMVEDEDGQKKAVFRRVEDMLKARVDKFPEDKRAIGLYKTFIGEIQPKTAAMEVGETIVFFSPPNWGGELESEYGFVYLLKKRAEVDSGTALVSGLAVKLDLTEEEYRQVYQVHQRRVYGTDFEGEPKDAATPVFVAASDMSEADLLESLLEPVRPKKSGKVWLLEEERELSDWLKEEKGRYEQLREQMELRRGQFRAGLVAKDQQLVEQLVVEVQMEAVKLSDPERYELMVAELEEKGWVEFLVACGLIRWGNLAALKPEDFALMGTDEWEKKIFICENCGHVHHIDVDEGETVSYCESCGVSADC